jgi:hypothetical protein
MKSLKRMENGINHTTSTEQTYLRPSAAKSASFYTKLSKRIAGNIRAKRRLTRYGLVGVNVALLLGVGSFVAGSGTSTSADTGHVIHASSTANSSQAAVGPLDQLSSVDVAVSIARSASLPEAVAVTNQSDSAKITSTIAEADTTVVAKPQVVANPAKNRLLPLMMQRLAELK